MAIEDRFVQVSATDPEVERLGRPVFSPRELPSTNRPPLRLSGIVEGSVVDGPGVRLAVFAQGCPHRCPGCHNPQTHDFTGGTLYSPDDLLKRLAENPMAAGLTLSGGEPFAQAEAMCALAEAARQMGYSVVTYTGYTLEELSVRSKSDPSISRLLMAIDLLIDGKYVEAERSLTLPYRGSANQRLWLAHP